MKNQESGKSYDKIRLSTISSQWLSRWKPKDMSQSSLSNRIFFSWLVFHLATGNDFINGINSVFGVDNKTIRQFLSPWSGQLNVISSSKEVKLGMDEAYLKVTSIDKIEEFLIVYGVSDNCYKCHVQELKPVSYFNGHPGFVIDTRWPFRLFVTASHDPYKNCSKKFHFGEYGRYTLAAVFSPRSLACALRVDVHPINSYIPIAVAAAILVGLALLAIFFKWMRRRRLSNVESAVFITSHLASDLGTESQTATWQATTQPTKKRLRSLDAFRGLSLTIMVFVNFGGGGYWFFDHSRWNGLTVADLVFPWFIFIMGVSMALSFRSLFLKDIKKTSIFVKIVRRTLILFALGLLLNKGTNMNLYRIPGVLQRFAFSYFVVATLELFLRYSTENAAPIKWWYTVREVMELWMQWIVMLGLLTIYCVLTYAVHVPGCPTGYTGPGGIGEGYPEAENCTGGMAGYLDRQLFGQNHIYAHPTAQKLYRTNIPYDPEGALGALTSAFLTFLGLQAGKTIVIHSGHIERERRLICWSLILGFIAIGLSGGSKNEGLIPLNKNLWSLSFILATGSMAFLLLAFCYFTIDDRCWWSGAPFIYPGMNSILVYCGHEVLTFFFPFNWKLYPPTHGKKLAMNLWGAGLWVLIAYYCYRLDFFVKI